MSGPGKNDFDEGIARTAQIFDQLVNGMQSFARELHAVLEQKAQAEKESSLVKNFGQPNDKLGDFLSNRLDKTPGLDAQFQKLVSADDKPGEKDTPHSLPGLGKKGS